MSRAEKFISDCTRNCSNYTGVINKKTYEGYYIPWITPEQARKAVEIAREEMFEKVCEFLDNDLCCYIKAQDFAIEHQRLENDLKQAIRNET